MSEHRPEQFAVLDTLRDAMVEKALELARERLPSFDEAVERVPGATERIAITILMGAANKIALDHKTQQAGFFAEHLRRMAAAVAGWNRQAN